ncbi:MAG: class I SAM-dependent methyltransferase, partial [Acetobacteraceae bacterium]|nr:class I SAM-dependent methyltransferase [Acetobacteraceae bacterium]
MSFSAPPIVGLECPWCRSADFDGHEGRLECRVCASSYPVLGRVPVMFRDAVPVAADEPDAATARQLLEALGLGPDSVDALRVRQVFRRQARFGSEQLQVEGAQFLDRVRSTGHAVGGVEQGSEAAAPPQSPPPGDALPRYRWTLDHIPRALPRADEITANARFRNTGLVPFHHRPPNEMKVHVSWFDDAGGPVDAPDVRTPLPLDIPPGREVTLPVFIPTPRVAGRMLLRLSFVQEGIRFLHDDAARIPVKVGDVPAPAALPAGWVLHEAPRRDYNEDHRRAQETLERWLKPLRARRLRVLEIGGNVHPTAAGLANIELHNLDVGVLGLQLGEMVHWRDGKGVAFLCGDAEDLPFPPAFFDAVVMFATLHHFPDPARMLGHVATRVRPGGFVGVLCEPVGHIHPGTVSPEFLSELRKGANEQSFTLPEYDAIFRRARLRAEEAFIDVDSLK